MFTARSRNHSLKTLYQPKLEQQEEIQKAGEKTKRPHLLPTIAENKQLHRVQAKQLGHNIHKFKHALTQSVSDINQEELIRNTYYIIKNFGEVDNNFKQVFIDLQIKLKDYLFLSDQELSHHYNIRQGCSYKKAIKLVHKYNSQIIARKSDRISELENKLNNLELQYNQQQKSHQGQITHQSEQIQKYKKMANVQYVKMLERKVANLKEAISSQEEEYTVLAKKNEVLSIEMVGIKKCLQEDQTKCAVHQSKIYDLSVLKDKTQIYLLKLKDRFEELAGRMESLQAIIHKVEAQNQTLVAERVKLVNRAAAAFYDLTPRPKYSSYFAMEATTNLLPTKDIVNLMIDYLPSNKQQIFQKYFISKKNKKLQECQAIRQQTIQQIAKAKRSIDQLL